MRILNVFISVVVVFYLNAAVSKNIKVKMIAPHCVCVSVLPEKADAIAESKYLQIQLEELVLISILKKGLVKKHLNDLLSQFNNAAISVYGLFLATVITGPKFVTIPILLISFMVLPVTIFGFELWGEFQKELRAWSDRFQSNEIVTVSLNEDIVFMSIVDRLEKTGDRSNWNNKIGFTRRGCLGGTSLSPSFL